MSLYINQEQGPNGERIQTCRVDEKKLFEFYEETGVLGISIDPGDLEILLIQIGEIPSQGKDLSLRMPEGFGGRLLFRDVKRVEQIKGIKEKDYLYGV